MKIRITGHDGEGVFPFGNDGPWAEFKKVILRRGHKICSSDYSEPADAIIANSFNSEISKYIEFSKIPIEKRILVLWEPYIVDKSRYSRNVLTKFGKIYAPSIHWAEKVNALKFNWPQSKLDSEAISIDWNKRINRVVMIQGNKFSARKGELYTLRRNVLRNLSNEEIDLYGTDWNRGIKFDFSHWAKSFSMSNFLEIDLKSISGVGRNYTNYLGRAEDKKLVLQNYRVSIVIENSADYVSEKLFHSVSAGCVTVYIGPSLEKYEIPSGSAIVCQADTKVIVAKIRELLALPGEVMQQIASSQKENLMKVAPLWENNYVLKNLAKNMLSNLELQEIKFKTTSF
jgi:hypothetical protein